MTVPGLVQSALAGEDVAAQVPLKGEDVLYVTPTRTIIYNADGLLSDESVDEYPHDAERVVVSESRRKAKVELDYGLDGNNSFSVPGNKLDEVLHPVLAGVLNAAKVTGPGETVKRTYRFSELTLVVTSDRIVKHIGAAAWDPDYEEIEFDHVTGLRVEEGSVASQLVIETGDGRQQRIKVPNEQMRDVHETAESALLAFHDVDTYEAFERLVAVDEDEAEEAPAARGQSQVSFESDLDPIETSSADDEAADQGQSEFAGMGRTDESGGQAAASTGTKQASFDSAGFESAVAEADIADELDALREAIEAQQELLERQQAALADLEAALTPDR